MAIPRCDTRLLCDWQGDQPWQGTREDSLLGHTLPPWLQSLAKRRIIQIMGTSYIFSAQNLLFVLETKAARTTIILLYTWALSPRASRRKSPLWAALGGCGHHRCILPPCCKCSTLAYGSVAASNIDVQGNKRVFENQLILIFFDVCLFN